MSADFRISLGFFRHKKTRRLRLRLGEKGILCLLQLWEYVTEFNPDGFLTGWKSEDFELSANWDGETGAFFEAIKEDWLDGEEGQYSLHEWAEHNPWVSKAKERSEEGLFNKLAQVNRAAHQIGKENGIKSIIKNQYEDLKEEKDTERIRGIFGLAQGPPEGNGRGGLAPTPTPTPKTTTPPQPPVGDDEATSLSKGKAVKSSPPYREIVDFLNQRTGSDYRYGTKETQRHIKARFNAGFTLSDFKLVIDFKAGEWLQDAERVQFLRPQTLFGTKFEGYLQAAKRAGPGAVVEKTPEERQQLEEELRRIEAL